MDSYETYRKYRNLNAEYGALIERVRRNRDDARRFDAERQALNNTLWEADAALTLANAIEDPYKREMAIEQAQQGIESASEAINRNNRLYEDTKKELEQLKRGITDLLDRLQADREASRKIDAALLSRCEKSLAMLLRRCADAEDFHRKLGVIMDNVSGRGISASDTGEESIHLEYNVTMTTIASLTDLIEYFEEQEQRLLADTVEEAPKEADAPPTVREKTDEEKERGRSIAQDLLESEIRPRRRERAKNMEKLSEIISTEARKVDLDPRELEGIRAVEEMQAKRDALVEEMESLTAAMEAHRIAIRQIERKVRGSGTSPFARLLQRLRGEDRAAPPTAEDAKQETSLLEPEETEEERFVYRYRLTVRELNRRYNRAMGIPDSLTEDAYTDEEE